MKTCKKCSLSLDLSQFRKDSRYADGYVNWCKPCYSVYARQWRTTRWEKDLWISAKHRAVEQEVPFEIDVEDIVIPEFCPILGLPLAISEGHSSTHSATLDKILPELGYVRGNVQVISNRANRAKGSLTPEELLSLADWSYKTFGRDSEQHR